MKQYKCKACKQVKMIPFIGTKIVVSPCMLIVDDDGYYPLYCPYDNKEAKFKEIK